MTARKKHYTHLRGEQIIRCPYRCLSALPLDQAHPCGHVRTYWNEYQSGYWWSAVHRLGWDAGTARAI